MRIETKEVPADSWVHDFVKRMSQNAGIQQPIIRSFDSDQSDQVETFVSRSSDGETHIAISSNGITMSDYDVMGGIAHEIAHIANKDDKGYCNRLLSIICPDWLVISLVMFLPFLIKRIITGVWIYSYIPIIYILWLSVYVLLVYMSRQREYKADLKACRLLEDPTYTVKWLEDAKKTKYGYSDWERFYVVRILKNFLAKSPTVDNRILKLRKWENYNAQSQS